MREVFRIVRLSPFCLEVIREEPDKPWDTCVATFSKRRDAERWVAAQEARRDA